MGWEGERGRPPDSGMLPKKFVDKALLLLI